MANVKAVHIKGVTFMGVGDSKSWVPMDGPETFGGSDSAVRPKELILHSLAGCTGSDVASILTKMRVLFTRFEVAVSADMADEHPKVFTKMEVVYKFWGENLDITKIERAIDLSENTYCAVSAMLKKSMPIITRYEINPEG
jgi:putative redox protein